MASLREQRAVNLIVQKYGGSSLADADGIKRVAQRIVATRKAGHGVVVVVSAMGDTTDELHDLALEISPLPPGRELDMLLTAGERISMALVAMAIGNLGFEARSFTGSQAGVITDSTHGKARIIDVTPGRIATALNDGAIPIVAGFQGVSKDGKDITTLGRGGSDTTAVALAAALGAPTCEIYTDVDGVFTADPRIVPGARRIPAISYEEMLEMAACGAKVLLLRCVEYARHYQMAIHVRSSFSNKEGTWVSDAIAARTEGNGMDQPIITGVAHDRSEATITVSGIPDKVGVAAKIFRVLARAGINIDMIVQSTSRSTGQADISFTLPRQDGQTAMTALRGVQEEISFDSLVFDDRIGKISLIGAGMRSHPGVSADFFGALADSGINIRMISTSEIRISAVVDAADLDAAVTATHRAFGLEDGESEAVVYGGTGR
jgi:aspartate kinase